MKLLPFRICILMVTLFTLTFCESEDYKESKESQNYFLFWVLKAELTYAFNNCETRRKYEVIPINSKVSRSDKGKTFRINQVKSNSLLIVENNSNDSTCEISYSFILCDGLNNEFYDQHTIDTTCLNYSTDEDRTIIVSVKKHICQLNTSVLELQNKNLTIAVGRNTTTSLLKDCSYSLEVR